MAAAWVAAFGRRAAVDDATLAEVTSALRLAQPAQALAGFVSPDADPRLDADAAWVASASGQLSVAPGGPAQPFDGHALDDLALLVPWLFACRPAGDPLRSGIPAV